MPFEIEDVNAIPQRLLDGYADVTRGGGMTFEQVVFLGADGTNRAELHLKKGHVKKLEQFGFASRVDPLIENSVATGRQHAHLDRDNDV